MLHPAGTLWLTKAQAAEKINVSVRTLERYIEDGALPAYRVAGRGTVRLRDRDVDALMEPAASRDARPATELVTA